MLVAAVIIAIQKFLRLDAFWKTKIVSRFPSFHLTNTHSLSPTPGRTRRNKKY